MLIDGNKLDLYFRHIRSYKCTENELMNRNWNENVERKKSSKKFNDLRERIEDVLVL